MAGLFGEYKPITIQSWASAAPGATASAGTWVAWVAGLLNSILFALVSWVNQNFLLAATLFVVSVLGRAIRLKVKLGGR
jgi:hypothetical protein